MYKEIKGWESRNKIAFFDFDGTVTSNDSLLELIRFTKGNISFFAGFGILSPWLLAMKLKLASNSKVKEMVLTHFFGNMQVDVFNEICERFSKEKLPSIIRPAAFKEIQKHISLGTEVVIVSASPENYIQRWCNENRISLIGTKLETKQNRITGKIDGKNCYGIEKVSRIKELYMLNRYQEVFAYGDTPGDIPMLNLATNSYYKPFRK